MHTDTEMDHGDGKGPEVDLAREEALLTCKLRLLEEFTKKGLYLPHCVFDMMLVLTHHIRAPRHAATARRETSEFAAGNTVTRGRDNPGRLVDILLTSGNSSYSDTS
jgi:hypothetical protein